MTKGFSIERNEKKEKVSKNEVEKVSSSSKKTSLKDKIVEKNVKIPKKITKTYESGKGYEKVINPVKPKRTIKAKLSVDDIFNFDAEDVYENKNPEPILENLAAVVKEKSNDSAIFQQIVEDSTLSEIVSDLIDEFFVREKIEKDKEIDRKISEILDVIERLIDEALVQNNIQFEDLNIEPVMVNPVLEELENEVKEKETLNVKVENDSLESKPEILNEEVETTSYKTEFNHFVFDADAEKIVAIARMGSLFGCTV